MAILPRIDGRKYLLGSGVWFVVLGLVVGIVTVAAADNATSRTLGVAFGALLLVRGLLRLKQARDAKTDQTVSL